MIVTRTQYAVGQGGFHVAEISVKRRSFRYIYDCGAKNPKLLKDRIQTWPSPDKNFDWLVISSFDADHFNCAEVLIENEFKFKAIILPHLLDENLFKQLFFSYILNDMDMTDFSDVVNVFRRIVKGDFGRIIPSLEGSEINEEGLVKTNELAKESIHKVSSKAYLVDDTDWMLRFYSIERNSRDVVETIFKEPSLSDLKRIIEEIGKFLLQKKSKEEINKLLKNVKSELEKSVDTPTKISEHHSKIERKEAPPTATLEEMAKEAQKEKLAAKPEENSEKKLEKKKIKEILTQLFKKAKAEDKNKLIDDYNSASLCLYSGPVPGSHANWIKEFIFERTCIEQSKSKTLPKHGGRVVGWIGVGDITFKTDNSIDCFIQHYSLELMLAGTRMLPHHGAQSNYDSSLLNFRRFAACSTQNSLWVAAADPIGGGYRHPDGSIISECTATASFHLVSKDPVTTLQETITRMDFPFSIRWR